MVKKLVIISIRDSCLTRVESFMKDDIVFRVSSFLPKIKYYGYEDIYFHL